MPRPFSAMHRHDFCLACNVCKMYLMSNVNAPQNNWWLMITKRGQTFSDIKVWALRIIAGIALIVIGTICLPKIFSVTKQLLGDFHIKKEGSMEGQNAGTGKSLTNSKRNSKREKLAPLFSQRISRLKKVCIGL